MNSKKRHAISPTREENYADWYQEVLKAAELSEHSIVRGCMVIKPWGYALWENIQRFLDQRLKETGAENAYFPLLIPLGCFQREAQHIEGFAKECAVVTHHRLEKGKGGKLVPEGELEEPLVIRPTSEMMIGQAFANWIESYRDLPLIINQWANIVRWEMRTRMFLRTSEFLWQEGHTAHKGAEEAREKALEMLDVYAAFCHEYLALPVIRGEKSESERFPGAVDTYTIEAMMQDGKALQAGTSHFLGQGFAKSCDIRFQAISGELEYVWTSSWGVSTRLIGALVMMHSDDDGLVLPPKIAPKHIAILPVIHKEEMKPQVMKACKELQKKLQSVTFQGEPLKVLLDDKDIRPGEKAWKWIKKGIPIRIEVGMREIEANTYRFFRRDKGHKDAYPLEIERMGSLLEEIQEALFEKARGFQKTHTVEIETEKDFHAFFSKEKGFALCHWDRDPKIEEKIKAESGVTVRCIPLEASSGEGRCIFTGKKSPSKAVFAKAY